MSDTRQTEKDRLMAKRRAATAASARAKSAVETASTPTFAASTPAVEVTEQMIQRAVAIAALPKDNGSLVLPQIDKSREITSSDVKIPQLKVAQSMSKVVREGRVPLGNWYHTSRDRDLGTEVLVIPVDMQKTRSYYVGGSAGLMCRSFNFTVGEGTPGGLCEGTIQEQSTQGKTAGCPLKNWGEKTTTNPSGAPLCGENYNFTVIIIPEPDNEDSPLLRGVVTFRKTGISAAKDIIGMKMEDDCEWWDLAISIRLGDASSPMGPYKKPEAEYVGDSREYPTARARAMKLAKVVNSASIRATLEADPE